jgi:outer membrane protein OmpA-like peptidoglycan-associated protein
VDVGAIINIADQVEPRDKFQGVIGITFNSEIKSMIDSDRDGINNRIDLESNTPRGYPVDSRGIALDTDADGVPDGIDKEPKTPFGVRVNAFGVGIDSDEDGIYDGIDMEPNTPKGALVDKFGVALDDDKDGVPNGLDIEPNTPLGVIVNKNGVTLDDDKDGVPNGLDKEPDTPIGAKVDKDGISIDTDNDGVPDGIDLEPNTPKGILVDKSGRALIRQEYSLLREGLVRLNSISFAPGSSVISVESYSIIDEIGRLLRKYPSLKIQIGGHTDNTGDKETNYRISRDRALAVRYYLNTHFPDIQKDRLIAIGFGPDKPIASNATNEGRNKNRRVEFVVINQEELLNLKP